MLIISGTKGLAMVDSLFCDHFRSSIHLPVFANRADISADTTGPVVFIMGEYSGIPSTITFFTQGQIFCGQNSRSWIGISSHFVTEQDLTRLIPSSNAFSRILSFSSSPSMIKYNYFRITILAFSSCFFSTRISYCLN